MMKTVHCRGSVTIDFNVDITPEDDWFHDSAQAWVSHVDECVRTAIAAQAAIEFDFTDMNWTFT